MSDPLSAAVEAAVARAVAAQIPTIVEKLREALPAPIPPPPVAEDGERFAKLAEVCKRLGMHKTTVYRGIARGDLPALERLPSGLGGYRESTLLAILARTASGSGKRIAQPKAGETRP